jgi:hypothetical protein
MYFDLLSALVGGLGALGAQLLFDPGPRAPDDDTAIAQSPFGEAAPESRHD